MSEVITVGNLPLRFSCEERPPLRDEWLALWERARDIDKLEWECPSGETAYSMFLMANAVALFPTQCVHDKETGDLVCVFGAHKEGEDGAVFWLLGANILYDYPQAVMAFGQAFLITWDALHPYKKLQATLLRSNHKHIRWLKRLGFEINQFNLDGNKITMERSACADQQ